MNKRDKNNLPSTEESSRKRPEEGILSEEIEGFDLQESVAFDPNKIFSQVDSPFLEPMIDFPHILTMPPVISQEARNVEEYIMEQKEPKKQNKNTPRFYTRLAVKYLPKFRREYERYEAQEMIQQCHRLEEWRNSDKKNIYLLSHLFGLLACSSSISRSCAKKNRKVFNRILNREALQELKMPNSQVRNNKLNYRISSKIFALRCISSRLVQRNQSK